MKLAALLPNKRGKKERRNLVHEVATPALIFPRVSIYNQFSTDDASNWRVVGASMPSREKSKAGRKCDDYCHFSELFAGCGAVFVADGVGSMPMSRLGSELLARFAVPVALKALISAAAQACGSSPIEFLGSVSKEGWEELSRGAVGAGYDALVRLSEKTGHPIISFSSTLIACLILSSRTLLLHLGDGRGALKVDSRWRALFEPKVVEATDDRERVTNSVDCVIHDVEAAAVSVMTDGCERAAFLTRVFDEASAKYVAVNEPYAPFFDAIPSYVLALANLDGGQREAWAELLRKGTPKLEEESDDKTLVVAIRLQGAQ